MIPVYIPRFKMEGFAFLATRDTQEHYLVLTIALDNGEIWELSNREVRFCKNDTVDRHLINKGDSQLKQYFNGSDTTPDTSLAT